MTDAGKKARIEALTRLAIATREKVDRAAYVLFLENTAHVEQSVFVEACRRLETSVAWFPKVSELLEECRIVNARRQEARDEQRRRQLPPAPITDAQWAEIRRKFQQVLGRRRMP